MWSVPRPVFSAIDAYSICISRVRNAGLKARLEGNTQFISDEADSYIEHAENCQLHLVNETDGVGVVTTKEMETVYTARMVGKKSPGRHIYDAIKLLPRHDICPFCDHRPVSTLDHILPKSLYPALAVTPINLVGSCSDCNKTKLTLSPNASEEVILHPYFDDADGMRWLTAAVIEGPTAAIIFYPQSVPVWSDEFNERIRRQFRMLGLGALYSSQSARLISSHSHLLSRVHESRGIEGVRHEIILQMESWEADRLNSWHAAAYRAMSKSDWFCDGGFTGG
jgi:hypothetical protein